ncbi:hypothetical protein [Pantoea sp. Ap-967]|uniref:hypothetical protein n=1 Tax=Pantoea sp. Ap-967 TaxID=2608362 RepID=UPI00196602F3|nr:hypothetical protein [Pantoea sp. Ap-967]
MMAAQVRNSPALTTVYLSGPLIRKFFRKKDYLLDSQNTWEVFRALKATLEGFEQEITLNQALRSELPAEHCGVIDLHPAMHTRALL